MWICTKTREKDWKEHVWTRCRSEPGQMVSTGGPGENICESKSQKSWAGDMKPRQMETPSWGWRSRRCRLCAGTPEEAAPQGTGHLVSGWPGFGLRGELHLDSITSSVCVALSNSLGLYRLPLSNPHSEGNDTNLQSCHTNKTIIWWNHLMT